MTSERRAIVTNGTPPSQRILVLGATGLVGSTLCPYLSAIGRTVLKQGRNGDVDFRFDPLDGQALRDAIDDGEPDVIVNLVAATNVDGCEADPQAAYLANVRPIESLANELMRRGLQAPHLVQISTDQVYDGPGPHGEDDAKPCNVYALSKYAGELAAASVAATVLRTNLFGQSRARGRASLSDWVVSSLRKGIRITVFDDVLFSALHLDTLCDVIVRAISLRPRGVINAGCGDGISKADFALQLATKLGLECSLMTIAPSTSAGLRARRPLDMRMDPSRYERTFGVTAPTIESQIDIAAMEYRHEQS